MVRGEKAKEKSGPRNKIIIGSLAIIVIVLLSILVGFNSHFFNKLISTNAISTTTPKSTTIIPTLAFNSTTTVITTTIPSRQIIYVANEGNNTISVINATTDAVVNTIDVGQDPQGIVFNPSGTFAYITGAPFSSNGPISVINTTSDTLVDMITVSSDPFGATFNPSGSLIYVANWWNGTVSIINSTTNKIANTITGNASNYTYGVAFNHFGTYAYITYLAYGPGIAAVRVINVSTNATVKTIKLGSSQIGGYPLPSYIAVNPSGTLAYVTTIYPESGTVSVINFTTNRVVNTISMGILPESVAFNPTGTLAYVISRCGTTVHVYGGVRCSYQGIVSVINTTTDKVMDNITVGRGAEQVAFNPSGTLAYVTNEFNDTVSVINTTTDTVVDTIAVGSLPYGVATYTT